MYDEEFEALESTDKAIVQEYWDQVDDTYSPSDILEKLAWMSGDIDEFIDFLIDEDGLNLPKWLEIDYDKTWNQWLCHEFEVTDNYIFYI